MMRTRQKKKENTEESLKNVGLPTNGSKNTSGSKESVSGDSRQKALLASKTNSSLEKATADFLWGTEEEANPYRDEIVRTIFGDVGAIRRDFSCAIERKILLHGRLYVTERFICFYSNLFGFEKKIKIPYSYITCITKEYTAVFIPNAIAVITARKEYIFRSFWDRDECYDVLKQMHDMYRGVIETGPQAHIEEGHAVGRGSKDLLIAALPISNQSDSNNKDVANIKINSDSAADKYGHLVGAKAKRRVDFSDKKSAAPPRRGKSAPARQRPNNNNNDDDDDEQMKQISGTSSSTTIDDVIRPVESVGSLISLGSVTAIGALAHELASATFEISIHQFFNHFLADNASFSLAKFHEFQGDTDVSVTNWTETYRNDQESEDARELRFKRQLRSPIGPAATRTTKMQRCRRFGQRGIIMNTVMTMEDIPYRDCFSIEERWVAEPCTIGGINTNNQRLGTRIRFEFQVVWTKTTIWKRRIESSSKSDLESYYNAYIHAATAYLDSVEIHKKSHQDKNSTDTTKEDSISAQSHIDTTEEAVFLPTKLYDSANELIHSVFVVYRISWLVLLLVMLCITLIKQHMALVQNFKIQQQLLAELSALRGDLACSLTDSADPSCKYTG